MDPLPRSFFTRDTPLVARNLLGALLVHSTAEGRTAGRIVETEAYHGWDDQASHGYARVTPRNRVMFGPAGVSYVYLIYGMYWLMNVVAKPPGVDYAGAVLIRALEPVEGLEFMAQRREGRPEREWTSGPGRLTLALGIDGGLNQTDITRPGSPLTFEQGQPVEDAAVQSGPRVGLKVEEPWQSMPWRYWIEGNRFVSRGR
jgi:DNA-3-methyladenine glycosylase